PSGDLPHAESGGWTMGPGNPVKDKTPADSATSAADGDAAFDRVQLDSSESGSAPLERSSEGRELPPVSAPTSGESFDTRDPAAFVLQFNPPTSAHSSSPRVEHVGIGAERTATFQPSGDPAAVPTMAKADCQASPARRERPVPTIDGYEILG